MKLRPSLLLSLTLGFAAALSLGLRQEAGPALAQRNPPGGIDEATLRQYGTRHVLPLVGGTGQRGLLKVTNVGWKATQVLLVELAASGSLRCEVGTEVGRIKAVTCLKDLGRWQTGELALSGQDTSALVYSLDAAAVPDACQAFQAVRSGQTPLANWERDVQAAQKGEPIAVLAVDHKGGHRLTSLGQTLFANNLVGQRTEQLRGLAGVADAQSGQTLRVFNSGANCNPAALRLGPQAPKAADCRAGAPQSLDLGGYDARDLRPSLSGGTGGLTVARTARNLPPASDLAMALEVVEAKGGYRMNALASGAASGGPLAFPMAVGPMTGQSSELLITNLHVTATAKIALTMYDGNGNVHRLYNDAEELCAGATRRYDIQALAGEIPPTTGRGGGGPQRPPYLSLRAEATSAQLPDFVPLAGSLRIQSNEGLVAYAGQYLPAEQPLFRSRIDRVDGNGSLVAVVPDVKKNYGPDQLSTYLAIMNLQAPHPENIVSIDFYDESGKLVLGGVERALTPVAFLDTQEAVKRGVNNGGATPTPGPVEGLPDGFRGTALVRGQRIPGTLFTVLAIEHRTTTPPGPRTPVMLAAPLSVSGSVLLPSWPDPSIPTPTPRPRVTNTPGGPTPEPGTGTPSRPRLTPSVTPVEATPTTAAPTPAPGGKAFLPGLLMGGALGEGVTR